MGTVYKESVQQKKEEETKDPLCFSACFVDFMLSHAGVETNSDESIVCVLLWKDIEIFFCLCACVVFQMS